MTASCRGGSPSAEAVATREGGWRVRLYSDQAPIDFVWVWPYRRVIPPDRETGVEEADLLEPREAGPATAAPGADTPRGRIAGRGRRDRHPGPRAARDHPGQ